MFLNFAKKTFRQRILKNSIWVLQLKLRADFLH